MTVAPERRESAAEARLAAALSFSVAVAGREMAGTLTGSGSDLHLQVSDT